MPGYAGYKTLDERVPPEYDSEKWKDDLYFRKIKPSPSKSSSSDAFSSSSSDEAYSPMRLGSPSSPSRPSRPGTDNCKSPPSRESTRPRPLSAADEALRNDRHRVKTPVLGYAGDHRGKVDGKIGRIDLHQATISEYEMERSPQGFGIKETDPLP